MIAVAIMRAVRPVDTCELVAHASRKVVIDCLCGYPGKPDRIPLPIEVNLFFVDTEFR
jgi:hypothetical protein